jgi:hypothetical protein
MTLGTTTPQIDYVENGVTLAHAVPFQFQDATDIVCSRISDGTESILTLGADFTVTGGAGGTGTVNKTSAGIDGTIFRIKRQTTRAQPTDYTAGDDFPAETHEAALDRLAAVNQEQDVAIGDLQSRAMVVPIGELAPQLPIREDRALRYFGFDGSGDPIMLEGTGTALDVETRDKLLGKDLGQIGPGVIGDLVVNRIFRGDPGGTSGLYGINHQVTANGPNPIDSTRSIYVGTNLDTNANLLEAGHFFTWIKANRTVGVVKVQEAHFVADNNATVTTEANVYNVAGVVLGAAVNVPKLIGYNCGQITDAAKVANGYGFNCEHNQTTAVGGEFVGFRSQVRKVTGNWSFQAKTNDGSEAAPAGIAGSLRLGANGDTTLPFPAYRLEVMGAADDYAAAIKNRSGGTPFGLLINFPFVAPVNTTQTFLTCSDSVTDRLRIYSNGNVVNVNNSYGAISDAKLKRDVRDAGSQLADIRALQVRKYKMIAEGDDAREHIGLVAQEVEAVSPGLVFETPDRESYFEQQYEPGNVGEPRIPIIGRGEWKERETGTFTKGVQYSVLNLKLLRAVQELANMVEAQAVELGQLQRRLDRR